jgi:hypothetical protein
MLGSLRSKPSVNPGLRVLKTVIVVLPIKAGVQEHLGRLVAERPLVASEELGLERQHVFVTDGEVIFYFEGTEASLERALGDLNVVATAAAWRQFVAGAPRVAEDSYSWARVEDGEGLSFESTPGPGDSEGGDVYPPEPRLPA